MKPWILLLASALASTGCTTLALERHTLAQGHSIADLRYFEVLQNLALVAHDPSALPAYSSIFAGTAQVVDGGQLSSGTLWVVKGIMGSNRYGFLSETATPQLTRTVSENWSLDPMIAPEKIEALRCACRWVLFGREMACSSCPDLLAKPDECRTPGRHFGVADRLAKLPPGWLHVGCLKDVPLTTHYKAHCGDTWVWVLPDGMAGLADFTLIFQDIARVGINSESLFYQPRQPCVYARWSPPIPYVEPGKAEPNVKPEVEPVVHLGVPQNGMGIDKAGADCASAPADPTQMPQPMKPVTPTSPRLTVSAFIDRDTGKLWVPPYRNMRFENLGVDSSLRSQVSAAAAP
jgi:hypothetical protein